MENHFVVKETLWWFYDFVISILYFILLTIFYILSSQKNLKYLTLVELAKIYELYFMNI